LASQIPSNICNMGVVGRRRSANCATVARPLRHREHDAIPEAITQPASAREGERNLRLILVANVATWFAASLPQPSDQSEHTFQYEMTESDQPSLV